MEALLRYCTVRGQVRGTGVARRFFVTFRGNALGHFGVSSVFRKLC